jgi:sulfate transport system substrate-binding protein
MRRTARLTALALPLGLVAAGVLSSAPSASATSTPRVSKTINVVGYSIVSQAYTALETAFKATPAGVGISFNNSFGASTTQADNVVAGQPADVVNFSTQPDLQLLVSNGLVNAHWATTGAGSVEHGMVTNSYVVLVTRPGNPLHVTNWTSMTKSTIQTVTPDPISSGSARWNLLAVYESSIKALQTAKQAYNFTNNVVHRVVAEPSSGSKTLSAFLAGTGNVMISPEADALAAKTAGKSVNIVYPTTNMLIENPAALTNTGSANAHAKAFFAFMFSAAGQAIWAHQGFRPTLASARIATAKLFAHNYSAANLTTIASLKGWPAVNNKFFSPTGIITKIEAANGYTS